MKREFRFACRLALLSAVLLGLGPANAQVASQSTTPASRPALGERAEIPLRDIAGAAAAATEPADADEPDDVRDAVAAAREAREDGRFDVALQRIQDAERAAGNHDYFDVYYQHALLLLAQRRLDDALLAAERALRCKPESADANLIVGNVHHIFGRLDRAIAHYRSATLAAERELNNPHVTAAWYRLGQVLGEQGYLRAACESLARFDAAIFETHTEHRNTPEIRPILAQSPHGALELRLDLLDRLGDSGEAVVVATKAAQRDPNDTYLARLQARRILRAGQGDAALEFCRQRSADPAQHDAFVTLSIEAARTAGKLDAWTAQVEQDARGGREPAQSADIASALLRARAWPQAVRVLKALSDAAPTNAELRWDLAIAQRGAGDLRTAVDTLSRFIRENPAVLPPLAKLDEWMAAGPSDELLVLVRETAATRDFAADIVLAAALAGRGRTPLNEELFAAALQKKPDDLLAHIVWGRACTRQYRWDDARAHAEAALKIDANAALPHFILAESNAGLDRDAAAESEYKTALRSDEKSAELSLAAARFFARRGEGAAAERYFQQAWTLDPTLAEAAEELIRSYVSSGKIEIAREQLRQAQQRDLPEEALLRIRTLVRFAAAPYQEEHLAELRRQFDARPDDLLTGLQLAGALYVQEQTPDAAALLERLRGVGSGDDRWLGLYAGVQSRLLNAEAAIEALRTLAERYPNRQDTLARLGEAYMSDFRVREGREILRRMIELTPADEQDRRAALNVALLKTFVEFQDADGAAALLAEWDVLKPSDALELARLQALCDLGRGSDAVARVEAKLNESPAEPGTRELFVLVCQQAKDYARAEKRLRTWLADDPDNASMTGQLFETLLAARKFDAAAELAKSFAPDDWTGTVDKRIMIGRATIGARRFDEGVKEFQALLDERPIAMNPADRMRVRESLVQALLAAGESRRVADLCGQWSASEGAEPGPIQSLLLRWQQAAAQGGQDDETYISVMEKLLALSPRDPGLSNDLGYTLIDHGRQLERATAMVRRAVASDPLNAAFLDSFGWAYYKAGDWSNAAKHLSRAVQLRVGQDPVLYDHLGDAQFRLGDRTAARKAWEKSLELIEKDFSPAPARDNSKLAASLRAKLAAIEHDEPPQVAPTAEAQGDAP
ncbi:MAG: tetratricopeptide repeat protein [Phycisphaerae bacterium]